MLEAALFRHDRIPGDVLDLATDGASLEIGKMHAVGSDYRQVAIGQKENIAGVMQDRGYVRGHEIFVIAEADYNWRAIARGDAFVWVVGRDYDQSEDSS